MKTMAILSQKGGVGKTTVALHLAVAAFHDGKRVAVVDLDPQASARKWADKRELDGPEVVGDHAERLPQLAEAAKANGADLLVVDTAPNADRAALIAAKAADLILIPCRPAAFDLDAIGATRDLAEIARRPSYIVLSVAPVRSAVTEEARQGLERQGAKVAPTVIHQRVAYSHAVIDGRSAMEFEPDGKAAEEVRKLYMWARGQLGI